MNPNELTTALGLVRSTLPMLLAMVVSVGLAACGGGGADDEGLETVEVLIFSNPAVDGFTINRQGTILGNAIAKPAAGDLVHPQGQQTYRGIYHFDLPTLPPDARIVSVEFSVFQQNIQGDPYGLMGSLVADHIDMGAVFNKAAHNLFTLEEIRDETGLRIPLSTDSQIGRKQMDVTEQVLNDIAAGRPRSQFRVRGAVDVPDNDAVADLINLSDGSDSEFAAPSLRIVYELAPSP